ncbi:MAG: yidD 2 [Planctomycetota bacterium]|nr:yidD 2 [Planctomycetota bacterium]
MISALVRWPSRLAIAALVALIRGYQIAISPWLGQACRFHPSCSRYTIEALHKYGLFRGIGKGLWRIARCNPWNPGGYDPP